MTIIKSEPPAENFLTFCNSQAASSSSLTKSDDLLSNRSSFTENSRPALSNKSLNVIGEKKDQAKDSKKQQFENYLLNSHQVFGSAVGLKDAYGSNSLKKPIIKKETEATKSSMPDLTDSPVKKQSKEICSSTVDSMNNVKKKKLKSTDKFRKVSGTSEAFSASSKMESVSPQKRPLENPGLYRPIKKLLYESRPESPFKDQNTVALFQDLEQETEKDFCKEASSWSLSEWINHGQTLLNSQTELMGKLVQHRIELSRNFQAITSIINDRAEALNAKGEILDEKLKKIKNLGEEILGII